VAFLCLPVIAAIYIKYLLSDEISVSAGFEEHELMLMTTKPWQRSTGKRC
jgi:hypothetical protein